MVKYVILFFSIFTSCIFSYNVFNIDESVYDLQVKSWEVNGFSTDINFDSKDSLTKYLFSKGYFPNKKPLITIADDRYYSSYSISYTFITYPLFSLLGDIGINLTSLLFFIFLLLIFNWYLHKLGYKGKFKFIILSFFALGWPLFFYSWYFGGQVAGMFFAMLGLSLFDLQIKEKIKSTQLLLLINGTIFSLAVMMRDEYYIFSIAIFVYFIYNFILHPPKCKCSIVLPVFGFMFGVSLFWITNYVFYGHFLGNRGIATTVILDYLPTSIQQSSSSDVSYIHDPAILKRIKNILGLLTLYCFYQPYLLFVPIILFVKKQKRENIGYLLFFIAYFTLAAVVLEGGGGTSVGARSLMPTVPILFLFLLENREILLTKGLKVILFITLLFGFFATWSVGLDFYGRLRNENLQVYNYIKSSSEQNIVVANDYTAMVANDLQYSNKNIFSINEDLKRFNVLIEAFNANNIDNFLYVQWTKPLVKEGRYSFKDFDLIVENGKELPSHFAFNMRLVKRESIGIK